MEGDGTWEICIGTGSGEVRLEQTKTVEAGQRITLCLDTAVLGDTGADYLKLCVKPVSGDGTGKLCLYGVWGESDTMDDSTLAAHLRSIRRSDTVGEQADVPTVDLAWVFVICAIVIFSITIAVILGKRQEEEPSEQSRAGKTK